MSEDRQMELLVIISIISSALPLTQSAQLDSIQCYVQGECPHASLLPPTTAESYNECLANCQGDDECQWFTFYPDAQFCELMISCPDGPTAGCQEEPCYSGEAECKQLLQCDVNSLWCEDPHVGFWISVESLLECKDRCYEEQLCQWYNFDATTGACLLTPSCNASTTTCTTCIAGQKECLDDPRPAMNRLMVVGGYSDDLYAVEVIDLSGTHLTCPQLENGPISFGAVGTFTNGSAMVCAGANDPSHCYTYDNGIDEWVDARGSLVYQSSQRGSVVLSDGRWWLAGGYASAGDMDETEIVYPGNGTAAEPFAALPRKVYWPMMLQLNESAVIFIAGWGENDDWGHHDDLWLFNLDTEEWVQLPNMPLLRRGAAAGLATFPDGSRQLVVTGGGSKNTQAFDFDANAWRLVLGDLPNDLYVPSSVQFKDTFLLIGGRSYPLGESSQFLGTILEFDPLNEAWIVREETLRTGKDYLAAFLIPDDYVECV